jgi:hypothetical protein
MAGGGVGEAALLNAALTGAAVGGGMSAIQGGDPLQGALMGGLTGGAFSGASGLLGGAADIGLGATDFSLGQAGAQNALANASTIASPVAAGTISNVPMSAMPQATPISPYSDFGQANPFAPVESSNFLPGSQGPLNTYNNFSEFTPSGSEPILASGQGASGSTLFSPASGAAPSGSGISGLFDAAGSYLPKTTAGKLALGGGLGLAGLMAQERRKYGVPAAEKYSGPLSKFRYDPNNYRPDIPTPPANPYRAQYAAGGPVEMMSNNAAMGANTMYPMANMSTSSFATPYQNPVSTNMLAPTSDSPVGMGGETSMQGTRMAQGGQVPSYGFGGFIGDSINDIGSHLGSMFKGSGGDFGNVGPMLEGAQAPAGSKFDPVTQKYVPDGAQPMAKGGLAHYGSGGFLNDVFGDAAQLVGDVVSGAGNFVENAGEGRIGLGRPDRGSGYQPEDYSKNSYTYNPDTFKPSNIPSPNRYQAQYAGGGIASLGSYSDGGRMLKGPGDGMSDSIPARIGAKQEARLADGEFVVPADVVSHLGNGSTDAGAKQLYSMMDKVRQARTGRKAQGRQIKPNKYMPA